MPKPDPNQSRLVYVTVDDHSRTVSVSIGKMAAFRITIADALELRKRLDVALEEADVSRD